MKCYTGLTTQVLTLLVMVCFLLPSLTHAEKAFISHRIVGAHKVRTPVAYLSYFDESSIQKIKKRAATEKAFDTESILEKSKFWLKPNGRHAAVLIPLCNVNGRASILFTVRTDKVSTHKGQVSFPGGHLEPGETAAAAALRETGEELRGLAAPPPPRGPGVRVLGVFDPVPAITGTMVTPVLGFIEKDLGNGEIGTCSRGLALDRLAPEPGEVASVFALGLDQLVSPAFREMDDLGARGRIPAFTAGPVRIWGLTAYILDRILLNIVAHPSITKTT